MHKRNMIHCAAQLGAVEDHLFFAAPQAAPGSTE